MTNKEVYAALRSHIDHYWPMRKKSELKPINGPIGISLPRFLIYRVEPNDPSDAWVYFTLGVWEIHSPRNEHLEYFIISPHEDSIHVETLTMLANFHADPSYGTDLGEILEIGRPWVNGSTCDHLLVSLPYLFGPRLEWCKTKTATIRFLWLLPISSREAEFAKKNGVEALESKFEKLEIDYMDPKRPSVV
jgi:hypothetical protein